MRDGDGHVEILEKAFISKKKGVYKVAKGLGNHAITFKSAFDKHTVVFYDKKPSILLVILNVHCNCIQLLL